MTIKKRSKNYKEQEYCSVGQTVDRYGISVFREANHGLLEPALAEIGRIGQQNVNAIRGEGGEKSAAVNLLELKEAKTICDIGHISVSSAIDELYRSVLELRRQLKVKTKDVAIFGYDLSPVKAIGITLSEPHHSELLDERSKVIDTLNAMSAINTNNFVYIHPKVPHISLAKIRKNTPEKTVQEIISAVERTLPAELILKRAVIYNPAKS
jgi:hypothetical protein